MSGLQADIYAAIAILLSVATSYLNFPKVYNAVLNFRSQSYASTSDGPYTQQPELLV